MAVTILVRVTIRNSFSPMGTTLKVNMLDISARVDDVNIDTFTSFTLINILVECIKR